VDGATHSTDEVKRDRARTAFMKNEGYRVLRFTNEEIYDQVDRACEAILAALDKR
jgi:very-short-patch-repair endonuclease